MATASPSPHKSRRKPRKSSDAADKPSRIRSETLVKAPSFPLAAFLWPARTSASQWEVLPLVLMVVGLFRWAAGLWGYSGFQRPPMYGDYEAQRHWMEVTTNLPVSQWYFHDLQWWGLDYPPLTAYHSWAMGKVGALFDPAWFALFASRGSDDPTLKVFMRATVIVSEYLIYMPAAVVFVRRFGRLNGVATWTSSVALVAFLMQPATILIDHVHFQYNTVMLGLVVASMNSMLADRYKTAAVLFVAALGFKQMALYYAFSVFSYLLGKCVFPRLSLARLFGVALVTILSFAVLVLPLVLGTLYNRYRVVEQIIQMVHRIFPFSRGLFEDKVANFWCAANVVVKLRNWSPVMLQRASLGATLLAIIPPNFILFLRPRKTSMPLAFAATAWGFFLFSYQVHEKSVLLPLMPMTLLLAGRHGLSGEIRAWVGFANLLGAWTMFPLLRRVDLGIPYAVLTLLWAYLLGFPPTSWDAPFQAQVGQSLRVQWATAIFHGIFYTAMGLWHVVEATVLPPLDKPDLWVVANVGIGAAGFMVCYLWCLWKLVQESDILPPGRTKKAKTQ
ncbi:ALG6, ALG8 glycosyltransferase family protein [Hirsutella rhossiliensis]|uniref:Alpha-1,3-glucosyltransferase n=1 Tax=Hirsutella rhossiliensis TaxID=111463 RepID=A0A9P8SHU1_9HYPO|nr:ALG6, ALG8 glycosyltransferase family domain-containing protein [Hirsutella rhossiliensis]KAH0963498.1 ALG6, ALG8 glycosyltransferase family domain-containing protein [Hirsutella rhossiliensis]